MHNYFLALVATLDRDTLIIIPDFMSVTHLGAGPENSQGLDNGSAVPIFGVTFLYLDEQGDLQRKYVCMVCQYTSKSSYVTINYLRKIFKSPPVKRLIESKSKVFVTKLSTTKLSEKQFTFSS